MIERLVTQRACLRFAAEAIRDLPGPVLELGLGKGRTYDFLRGILPERDIVAFDREVHAPADCIPDASHLVVGEFLETLPAWAERNCPPAALVHADIGSEKPERDRRLAAAVTPLIDRLCQPGAIVITDRAMAASGWRRLPLPEDAGRWDYFIYRVEPDRATVGG
jgi:hypothetical protein